MKTEIHAGKLLDTVAHIVEAKNDAQLSRVLGVAPPVVSKLRSGKLHIGASHIVRVCDLLDMKPSQVRELAA